VVQIDPATVVAAAPAVAYEVLPQQAGLSQLLRAGVLKRQGDSYLVLRPMPRLPAGLYGAHSVQFVLGPGVPMPPGNPGHSSIRDENRRCLTRLCR
jgi:hypothetical protein